MESTSKNIISTVSQVNNVTFSSPISSEIYGLSSDWWLSEIVKIVLSITFVPLIFIFMLSLLEPAHANEFGFYLLFWIWFAILVVSLLYKCIHLFLWKIHYAYNFGEEYIYMKLGVLSVSEKNIAYNSIQDVRINQSFIDQLCGVADIIIENTATNMPILVKGLALTDARKIAEEMKSVVLNKTNMVKGL